MSGYVIVITTASSAEEAQKIASALVESRKAACVQTFPVASCYVWSGKIHNEPECMMMIKTQDVLYDDVEALIKSLHSYETPEIVCLPIAKGAAGYLDWISSVTR